MHVSDYFNLGKTQPTLDFVDVNIHGDTRLFLDPRALRLDPTPFGSRCVSLVQGFFLHVLDEIRAERHEEAISLLANLVEPNEVHLGLSKGQKSRGTGLGPDSAKEIWDSLRSSEAAQTGLLEDLEDSVLMVPNISTDRVSDIAINVIREPLLEYTASQAQLHGIPLQEGIDSGPLWDPENRVWTARHVSMPMTDSGKLLLVPKSLVRKRLTYDGDGYFRHYILNYLRDQELAAGSELVQLLKNGKRRVTKKALRKKFGSGKRVAAAITLQRPQLLTDYRNDHRAPLPTLEHSELAEIEGTQQPDWDRLLETLGAVVLGHDGAVAYEKAVEPLLTAVFYPALAFPEVQYPLHDNRKRVDIKYTNMAQSGFFWWVSHNYPAANIFVECKNYRRDVENPELDQLAGRFSPSRGNVGLLICRSFDNKDRFLERCRDTARDNRGFILALDDSDLRLLVDAVRSGQQDPFALLRQRFDYLLS